MRKHAEKKNGLHDLMEIMMVADGYSIYYVSGSKQNGTNRFVTIPHCPIKSMYLCGVNTSKLPR